MLTNEDTVSVLNHLIEISKDGEEGYLKSAEDIESQKLKSYLLRRSADVKQSVLELQNLVRELGGTPSESSTVGGYLHRMWIDVKTAIVNNDELAVLNELERGEDQALEAYREAAKRELPPSASQLVLRQLMGVQRNHDEVKELRDAAQSLR